MIIIVLCAGIPAVAVVYVLAFAGRIAYRELRESAHSPNYVARYVPRRPSR